MDLTFSTILLPLDFFAIVSAAVSAYALRFSDTFIELRPLLQDIPFPTYLSSAIFFAGVWLALFAISGLYAIKPHPAWNEFARIVLSATAGIMLVIAAVFFRREYTTSRFIVLAVWPLAILYVEFGRLILRNMRSALLRHGFGHQRLALIGNQETINDLRQLYKTHPVFGYTVVHTIRTWNESAIKQLLQTIKYHKLDAILLADPDLPKERALDIIHFAQNYHLTFRYLADLFAARFTNIEVQTDGGVPIIEVKRTPLDGWGRIAKRVFDVTISSILILLFSPIMLLAAFAIVIETRGGVFFSRLPDGSRVQRIGEKGKSFPYLKFRTMEKDSHWKRYHELAGQNLRKGDPLVKIKNDPRVTRVGRFLRNWSMDELPELFLVWLGRMSLVGPRPHEPEEVAHYTPNQCHVLMIKPGITGMAQTSGRSSLNFDEEVRLDTWYIENWSLGLDIFLLLKTPFVVIMHRGVEKGV